MKNLATKKDLSELFRPLNPDSVHDKIEHKKIFALSELNDIFASAVIQVALEMEPGSPEKHEFLNNAWRAYVIGMGYFGEHVITPEFMLKAMSLPNLIKGQAR